MLPFFNFAKLLNFYRVVKKVNYLIKKEKQKPN